MLALLVGAFACGALYVLAGMLPTATEFPGAGVHIRGFCAVVLSSLVLILPGTLGAPHPELHRNGDRDCGTHSAGGDRL